MEKAQIPTKRRLRLQSLALLLDRDRTFFQSGKKHFLALEFYLQASFFKGASALA